MEQAFQTISTSPLVAFTILLLVVLTIPPIFERLRLPGLVGLLVAGVFLGDHGLRLLSGETETMKLLSDIGKVYLMFVAGLEIDLDIFRKTRNRSMGFGLATFAIPMIMGTAIGQVFGFGWNASILIGSLLASHTLLGYPIVQRLGVVKSETVAVTVGATIFTDISALLVLAICVSVHQGHFSVGGLIIQLLSLALYAFVVLYGFDRAGREFFRRTGDEEGNQFLFVLLAVFLASVGAQAIHIEQIVGAFLAGLAVNDVVGNGPVKEKVEFVGGVLFIPFFFVGMGLLLDVPAFIATITSNLGMTLAIVLGLILSKFLAALVVKFIYHYDWNGMITMWSLSLPQVAATLAATLAGVQVGLLTDQVFNSVIVMMVVTSLLGPLLTERFASRLPLPKEQFLPETSPGTIWWETQTEFQWFDNPPESAIAERHHPFTIVVSVSNPLTTAYLIEMASMIARRESGQIVPLAVAKAHVHMDEPELDAALGQSQRLLQRAMDYSRELQIPAEPKIRIDDDVAHGISRTAREQDASLIVMGWRETAGFRDRLFGSVIDNVFWASHCPVAVTRLLDDPPNLRRILVPVKNITPQAVRTIQFALLFAETNQASVTVLRVCDRRTPSDAIAEFESDLSQRLAQHPSPVPIAIKSVINDNVAEAIVKMAESADLVVLRSMRRRTAGGLAVSDVTTEVVKDLPCSMVLFGEPHS